MSLYALNGIGPDERRSDLHARFDLGVTAQTKAGPSVGVGASFEGLGGDGYKSRSAYGTVRVPLN